MRSLQRMVVLGLALSALVGLAGCNLYGAMDKPSGNDQLLSAARACLDNGDFNCAVTYYNQLESSDPDVANMELAFTVFAQQNASMENLASAFGNGDVDPGTALSTFAGLISSDGGSGQTRRVAIYNAFENQKLINDPTMKALVQFVGSLVFAAELLSEDAQNGAYTSTDVSANPTACKSLYTSCSADPYKKLHVGTALSGSGDLGSAALTDINVTQPSFYMFNAALTEAVNSVPALTNGKSGSFANNITTIGSTFKTAGATDLSTDTTGKSYRAALLNANIGLNQ